MGTLFEQPPRTQHLDSYAFSVEHVMNIISDAPANKATPELWAAAARVAEAALKIQNADTYDEQLAGFGEIAIRFVDAVEAIGEALGRIADSLDERE